MALTAQDIYHLTEYAEDEQVKVIVNQDNQGRQNVHIENSHEIITPWVQILYCGYLNHINEDTKDVITGSSFGAQHEWMVHNLGSLFYKIIGDEERYESAAHADIGATIFADDHGGIVEHGMKITKIILRMLSFRRKKKKVVQK